MANLGRGKRQVERRGEKYVNSRNCVVVGSCLSVGWSGVGSTRSTAGQQLKHKFRLHFTSVVCISPSVNALVSPVAVPWSTHIQLSTGTSISPGDEGYQSHTHEAKSPSLGTFRQGLGRRAVGSVESIVPFQHPDISSPSQANHPNCATLSSFRAMPIFTFPPTRWHRLDFDHG